MTDPIATLILAKNGDEQAKEQLLLYYEKEIFDVASTYQNVDGYAIEDLVQEGKILLTKLVEIYDENKGAFGGLLRIALGNKFKDLARKQSPVTVSITSTTQDEEHEEEDGLIATIPSNEPTPFDVLSRMDEMKSFYKSLQELLTEDQYAVMCLYLQNYSYKEIATRLNLTTKKVDNLILASKKKIKNSTLLK
jgi:RNA polymerase sigma factor (sigma-70 family)